MDDLLDTLKTRILNTLIEFKIPPAEGGCMLIELAIPLISCEYSQEKVKALLEYTSALLDDELESTNLSMDVGTIQDLYNEHEDIDDKSK